MGDPFGFFGNFPRGVPRRGPGFDSAFAFWPGKRGDQPNDLFKSKNFLKNLEPAFRKKSFFKNGRKKMNFAWARNPTCESGVWDKKTPLGEKKGKRGQCSMG